MPANLPASEGTSASQSRRPTARGEFLKATACFALGLSPVGFVVPYLLFAALGYCSGALGSGVHCRLPVAEEYFEFLAVMFEVSCFLFGLCLVWGLAALAVWLGSVVFASRAIYYGFKAARILHEQASEPKWAMKNSVAKALADMMVRPRHLRSFETSTPGVYDIHGPRWPWSSKKAEEEKARLLEAILEHYPHCVIWLENFKVGVAEGLKSLEEKVDLERQGGWFRLPKDRLRDIHDRLYQSAWAMGFFETERDAGPEPLAYLPRAPAALSLLIGRLDAGVAVTSWHDESEWLVAIAD